MLFFFNILIIYTIISISKKRKKNIIENELTSRTSSPASEGSKKPRIPNVIWSNSDIQSFLN
jgi:hypothetical protein